MKPILQKSIAAGILFFSFSAQAQMPNSLSTAKTTGVDERVIGITEYEYTNSAGKFTIFDSSGISWSGTRSSEQKIPAVMVDAHDQLVMLLFNTGTTLPYKKEMQKFDPDGKLIETFVYRWNNSIAAWEDDYKIEHKYSGKNRVQSIITGADKSAGGAWFNRYQAFYTYTGSNITEEYAQLWNRTKSTWENAFNSKKINTYTGSFLSEQIIQDWSGTSSSWVNYYKINCTYTGTSVAEKKEYNWDATSASWMQTTKITYTYSGSNLISELTQYPDGSGWSNGYRKSYVYGGSNVSQILYETWVPASSSWENSNRSIFMYNPKNKLIAHKKEFWDGGVWQPEERYNSITNYYYESYSGIAEIASTIKNTSLFPNPASTNVYVDYFTETNESSKVTISNMLGQEIMSKTEAGFIGDHSVLFPVQSLAQGTYLVSIYSNGQLSKTLKLVK